MKLFLPGLLVLILVSCNRNKESTSLQKDTFESFDQRSMLNNLANNIILPAYQEFEDATQELSSNAKKLERDFSLTSLNSVRSSWKTAAIVWRKCELYNFGPVADVSLGFSSSINYHARDTIAILKAARYGVPFTSNYVETLGSSAKGLPALEYLLFPYDDVNTVFSSLSDTVNSAKIKLVVLYSESLMEKAYKLNNEWKSNGGNYISRFVSSEGKSVSASISLLTNEMINLVEGVRKIKLGKPIGKYESTVSNPKLCEAYLSKTSKEMMLSNIQSIEYIFKGNNSVGFDDLLNHMNADYKGSKLADVIIKKIESIKVNLNGIYPDLESTIVSTPLQTETLYQELLGLQVLLKVDMVNKLGIALTISDNDGD